MKLDQLDIYELANELSDITWDLVKDWDYFLKDTIGKQMMRSVDSVSANIAEGYGRRTPRDRALFYVYSRGSLLEYRDWLGKVSRRGFAPEETCKTAKKLAEDLYWKINRYLTHLKKQERPPKLASASEHLRRTQ